MFTLTRLAILFSLVIYVAGHAKVTSPTPRKAGAANKAACGAAVNKVLTADESGPIENAIQKIDGDYNADECKLFVCRSYLLEDNTSNTRAYSVGQTVAMSVDITAHHTGYANVSVIDLAKNVPIARLYTWEVYANETLGPSQWPKDESEFSVTIPDLKSQCSTGGACAIQWFWYAYSNKQTYESCVDFTVV